VYGISAWNVRLERAIQSNLVIAPSVQTIILEGQREYAMFVDLKARYHWLLEPHQYKSKELLIAQLSEGVIAPAEVKAKELARKF
jgi:hypothetical protein